MIKYKTSNWDSKIEPIECIRETDAFIYVPGWRGGERREAKSTTYNQIHDSWEEAHQYLIARAEGEVKDLRLKLEQANGRLGQIKGMKPPKVQP